MKRCATAGSGSEVRPCPAMRRETTSAEANRAAMPSRCTVCMPGMAHDVTWIAWLTDVADSQSLNA